MKDHYSETVNFRLAAGVLGLLTGVAAHLLSPVWKLTPALRGFGYAGAFAAFGSAGAGTFFIGISQLIWNQGSGAGAMLSAATIALPVAAVSGLALADQALRSRRLRNA